MSDMSSGAIQTSNQFTHEALSAVRETLSELISAAGAQNVANAGANVYGEAFVEGMKDLINSQQGIPQAKKDEINEAMDAALASNKVDTSAEAQDVVGMMLDMVRDMAEEDVKETSEAVGEGQTNEGAAGGGGKGNWLVQLAKAMGAIAGKHLEKMIEAQEKIGALEGSDSKEAASAMTELTAELQAHTQMFKMMQEAMTTVIKSVGEALNSTARKQ